MKKSSFLIIFFCLTVLTALTHFACKDEQRLTDLRYTYENILDIAYTPDSLHACHGWFTDAGSWMGFTVPEQTNWVNGFCGPFSLDMNRRYWFARSVANVSFFGDKPTDFSPEKAYYFPGEVFIAARSRNGEIIQWLNFIDANTALLCVGTKNEKDLLVSGDGWNEAVSLSLCGQSVVARHESGEAVAITFERDVELSLTGDGKNYVARVPKHGKTSPLFVSISFFTCEQELLTAIDSLPKLFGNVDQLLDANLARWNGYLEKVLRKDMPEEYNRIAVKALTTLISNWRVARGGLLHDGIIPSHAVDYFVGFWAWDSWRFSVAAARFAPELAKNNLRAMFDYQLDDGMIIDCIYTDPAENNMRDSKPPLACWAVDEIFRQTGDTAFVSEMYPQLLKYFHWWYEKRDHDRNGICEYGSTDGSLEAAAWESGMDNAIRFDATRMLRNNAPDAWSMDQESVDLNAYLALEARLLRKFAELTGKPLDSVCARLDEDMAASLADYFFDPDRSFFFDRRLADGSFITEMGCEAYTPLWTQIASPEQVSAMLPILQDTLRFSTFIPFPTVAADNPKYDPRGYWRGPIWLDQTYFAISGLRRYGYSDLADTYTLQVFDRLDGMREAAPIHENYGTHDGSRLKAPHFSWSAVHLLLLFEEFGK